MGIANINPADLAAHPEVLAISAALGVVLLTVPPLLEYRAWKRKHQRFERWLVGGPSGQASLEATQCPLCSATWLETNTVAALPSRLKLSIIQCVATGKVRYQETRCRACGTTIERRRVAD